MNIIKKILKVLYPILFLVIIPIAITFLIMWYFVYIKLGINPLFYKYEISDIIVFVVGILTYYGTVFLGYVSIVQNKRLVIQNEKLFFTDKSTSIVIMPKIKFKQYDYNSCFLENSHDGNSANYYIVSTCQNTNPLENYESLSFIVKYRVNGPDIKKMILEDFKINIDNSNFYIDKNVKTDIVSKLNSDNFELDHLFEIVILGHNIIYEIKNLLNEDYLVIDLIFKIKNIYNVNTKIKMTLNFEHFLNKNSRKKKVVFINAKSKECDGFLDNVSYNFIENKGENKNDNKN